MNRSIAFALTFAFALFPFSLLAFPDDLYGTISKVKDGDTVVLLTKKAPLTVRLSFIDAPESSQPYGPQSTSSLRNLCLGEPVRVVASSLDRYGRTLGAIYLCDGTNVNLRMVSTGAAWWYRKYAPKAFNFETAEFTARLSHVGLWASADPKAPWIYRHSVNVTPLSLSDTVYRTKYGSKFHRVTCPSLRSSRIPLIKSNARIFNLTPCRRCKP